MPTLAGAVLYEFPYSWSRNTSPVGVLLDNVLIYSTRTISTIPQVICNFDTYLISLSSVQSNYNIFSKSEYLATYLFVYIYSRINKVIP